MISTTRRTHDEDWGVSVYTYPDSTEATAWKGIRYGNKKGVQRDVEKQNREDMNPETLAAAISRAKKTVRVKCASIGADHLLTLTYRENMLDMSRAWADFKKVLRLMRAAGWDQHYVAVGEYQKRGACHIHMAVSGKQDVKLWRSCWHQVVGQIVVNGELVPNGNIDVAGPKKLNKKGLQTSGQIAYYLSKYISKDAEQGEIGRNRYRTSLNIEIKKNVVFCSPSIDTHATQDNLARIFHEQTGVWPLQEKPLRDGELWWFASWSDSRRRLH